MASSRQKLLDLKIRLKDGTNLIDKVE